MEQQIGATLMREHLLALLSGAFAGLALILSCIVPYGVVSSTSRAARGIPASASHSAPNAWTSCGTSFAERSRCRRSESWGVIGAVAATRLLSALLFGITARDFFTLASAGGLLLLTMLVASYVPARRASRVDPVVVLRAE